jgi:glycosyltransferase involved in cell wall biosynthesis
MKILHIITGLNTGGAETMLLKLIREADSRAEKHIVISMMDKGSRGKEIQKYCDLHTLNLKQGKLSFSSIYQLIRIAKRFKPDIIQGWMYHGNLMALILNFFIRKKLFWNIRQTLVDINQEKKLTKVVIKLNSIFSNYVTGIIYNSLLSIKQHENYGFCRKNSIHIANRFDDKFYKITEESINENKSNLGLSKNTKVIGMVARYHPMKNHLGFIKNITPFLQKNSSLYCILIGTNINQQNEELVKAIQASANPDRFLLLGEKEDLTKYYNIFDYCVSSSLWGEAFPNIIGESMACGTPCIVSDVGDSKLIIDNWGFSYEPNSRHEFAQKIEIALNLGAIEYNQLAKKCQKHIAEFYSIVSIYDRYIKNYTK